MRWLLRLSLNYYLNRLWQDAEKRVTMMNMLDKSKGMVMNFHCFYNCSQLELASFQQK